jgi:predicted RND superfamily exporter protein
LYTRDQIKPSFGIYTEAFLLLFFPVLIYKIPHWKKCTTEDKKDNEDEEEETRICRHYYAQRQAYFIITSVRCTLYWRDA